MEDGRFMQKTFPAFSVRFIAVNDQYDSNAYAGGTADMDTDFKYLLNDLYTKDISAKIEALG